MVGRGDGWLRRGKRHANTLWIVEEERPFHTPAIETIQVFLQVRDIVPTYDLLWTLCIVSKQMNNKNSNGPKMLPCGTPEVTGRSEVTPLIETSCCLCERYSSNHFKSLSPIPREFSLNSRPPCDALSKAFLKSSPPAILHQEQRKHWTENTKVVVHRSGSKLSFWDFITEN